MAWVVWYRAAESALADAFRFSGGPLPAKGLVLGRGSAVLRVVQLVVELILRMLLTLLMSFCIVIPLLLLFLI